MKTCPKCRLKYDENYVFCKKCGNKLIPAQEFLRSNNVNNKNNNSNDVYYVVFIVLLLIVVGFGFYHFNNKVVNLEKKVKNQKTKVMSPLFDKNYQDYSGKQDLEKAFEKDMERLKIPSKQQTVKPTIPRFYDGAISEAYHSSADVEGSYVHSAQKAIDGNIASCWAEGVAGLGVGENIVIRFNGIYELNGMYFWSGHQKTEALYYKNARPTAVRVVASDGYNQIHRIRNIMGMQTINFYRPVYTDEVKIVLESCDSGTTYADTCIAEVNFF